MQRLKRKDAKGFWVLFWAFWGLEGTAWVLRLAGENHSGILDAASWIRILAFLPLRGAGLLWRFRLQCPNCHDRGRSGSVRLNPRKRDRCKSCGQAILFDDQEEA